MATQGVSGSEPRLQRGYSTVVLPSDILIPVLIPGAGPTFRGARHVAIFAVHPTPEAGGFARVAPGPEASCQSDLPYGGQGTFSMKL